MVLFSQDDRSGPAGSVRESDRYRPGHGPQAGPAGSEEAAEGSGHGPGQLQRGEAGFSEPGPSSDPMGLQIQTNNNLIQTLVLDQQRSRLSLFVFFRWT